MILIAALVSLLGHLMVYVWVRTLPPDYPHREPGIYRVCLSPPPGNFGCGGCLVALAIYGLSVGIYFQSRQIEMLCSSAIAVGTVLFVHAVGQKLRRRRAERSNLARIVVEAGELTIFDRNGKVVDHVRFQDVERIARYHGRDRDRQEFDDCVLHLANGREVILEGYIDRKKRLLKDIEQGTGQVFSYRKNSSRRG